MTRRDVLPTPDRAYTGLYHGARVISAVQDDFQAERVKAIGEARGGTPVTDDYPARGNEFNGVIKWVQIDLEPDDHSHMIDADHMAHVRLVKQ